MASNDLSSMETLITCSLCSKLYEDPRLLPCSHSYCFRCINQIITTNQDHFTCPSCDGSKVTQNDIDSLPSNLIIQDTIELYVSMKRPPVCAECESAAEFRCNGCQNYYCSVCDQEIHSKRSFRDHSRMSITNNKLSEILFCDKHPDTKLKNWCQDCHTPVCYECLSKEHKNHKYNPIDQSFNELETKIKTNFEYIQSSLIDKLKQADQLLNKVNIESEMNKENVSKAMIFLRQILDEHEKQMFQHIENFQRESIQQIENYKINLNDQLKYFHLYKYSLDLFISIHDQLRLLRNKSNFFNYIHQTNQQLEELHIPTGIDYHIIGNSLEYLNNIKELILQCARVTESSKQIISISEQGPQMERLIMQYQTMKEIDFSRQSLTDQNIHIIIQILKQTNKMMILNLSNNQIGPQGVYDLLDVLQNNQILTTLDLSYNEVNDDGTKYLANFLKYNTTLTALYLYDNGIGEQGVQYLSDILKTNTTLKVLDLQSNPIGYYGAQYLAESLRKNNILTTLYLSNNQIGNQGAQCLAEALQKNTGLTVLTLSDNQIDHEARRRVMEMLKANKRLAVHW